MGKSKSKSNSRSISKWKKFFSNGGGNEKTAVTGDSHEDDKPPPGNQSPNDKSRESVFSGNSRSKSLIKRRGIREEQKTTEDKNVEQPSPNPNSKSIGEEKKERKEEKVKKDEKLKKDDGGGGGVGGSKTEDVPVKIPKKIEAKKEEQEASVFEEVAGPAAPAQSGTHGIKNKMRWKIDVDGADIKGDQKMPEVIDKLAALRKKSKMKKCKVLKANEKAGAVEDDESCEDIIINSARVLQLIKLESLISKEIPVEADQELLRGFCRSGDQEDKAEVFIEKITLAICNAIVQKNEFIRQVVVPGELRMFAVDEKKAKLPIMALLMARKDLLYVSWLKPNRDVENTLDGTWSGMAMKKDSGGCPVRSTLL